MAQLLELPSVGDGRLGRCEVCNDVEAKYTCPKCEVKTCCLRCVKVHKTELECDGIRNKVAFKQIRSFTNLDLLSDYRLLEEVARSVDSYARDPQKYFTRESKNLPLHLFRLRAAATKRDTRLMFLPGNFSRHKENTTYLDWKTQVISWRIEWIFVHSNIKHVDNRIEENSRLSTLLDRHLDPAQCPSSLKESLQFYQSAGHSGISLLLKAEKIRNAQSKFHLLDPSMTVRQALEGKAIVEFPTVFVILSGHKNSYEFVDEDEVVEESEEENSQSTMTQNRFRNKKVKRKGSNFLFHSSDYSSDDSDSKAGNREPKNKKSKPEKKLSIENRELPINGHPSRNEDQQNRLALPSASQLLSGVGQFNIPPYDVLIRQPQ